MHGACALARAPAALARPVQQLPVASLVFVTLVMIELHALPVSHVKLSETCTLSLLLRQPTHMPSALWCSCYYLPKINTLLLSVGRSQSQAHEIHAFIHLTVIYFHFHGTNFHLVLERVLFVSLTQNTEFLSPLTFCRPTLSSFRVSDVICN